MSSEVDILGSRRRTDLSIVAIERSRRVVSIESSFSQSIGVGTRRRYEDGTPLRRRIVNYSSVHISRRRSRTDLSIVGIERSRRDLFVKTSFANRTGTKLARRKETVPWRGVAWRGVAWLGVPTEGAKKPVSATRGKQASKRITVNTARCSRNSHVSLHCSLLTQLGSVHSSSLRDSRPHRLWRQTAFARRDSLPPTASTTASTTRRRCRGRMLRVIVGRRLRLRSSVCRAGVLRARRRFRRRRRMLKVLVAASPPAPRSGSDEHVVASGSGPGRSSLNDPAAAGRDGILRPRRRPASGRGPWDGVLRSRRLWRRPSSPFDRGRPSSGRDPPDPTAAPGVVRT